MFKLVPGLTSLKDKATIWLPTSWMQDDLSCREIIHNRSGYSQQSNCKAFKIPNMIVKKMQLKTINCHKYWSNILKEDEKMSYKVIIGSQWHMPLYVPLIFENTNMKPVILRNKYKIQTQFGNIVYKGNDKHNIDSITQITFNPWLKAGSNINLIDFKTPTR